MPRLKLTELWIRHAHTKVDAPTEFTHDGVDFEFGVIVRPPTGRYPKGTKTFFTRYAYGGRRVKQKLGRHPNTGLAEALAQAREAQVLAGRGMDPRQPQRQTPEAMTFGELFELYFEARSRHKARPRQDFCMYRRNLSEWADRPAKSISRQDVREKLLAISKRAPEHARNVQWLISAVFNFGLDEEVLDKNPAHRLRIFGPPKIRDRVLTDEELRKLRAALRDRDHWASDLLHLMIVTGQRKGELVKMRWDDIHDGSWWRIPGQLTLPDGQRVNGTKNGRTHVIYLAAPALEVIAHQQRHRQPQSPWVFAHPRDAGLFRRPYVHYEVERMRAAIGCSDWRAHDLRRTVVTNLARLGCPRAVRMAIANHSPRHVHDRVYDQYEYTAEKKQWLTRWADFLDEIEARKEPEVLAPG